MGEEKRLNAYKKAVFGKKSPGQDTVEKALDRAHEIRKFEIGLYWQRSLIFLGFILSCFTGYFLLLRYSDDFRDESFVYLILLGLSFLGLFASVAWWFIERGARSWQKNWEYHIDFLEYAAGQNLHKTILGKPKSSLPSQYPDPLSLQWVSFDCSFRILIILGSG